MRLPHLMFSLVALLSLAACSGQDKADSAANSGTTTAEITANGTFTGKVEETVNAGGYTYARLSGGGQTVWAAARETELPVGTEVTVSTAMPMQNWHSESLDRTWDTVYFTAAFETPGSAPTSADPHQGVGSSGMASQVPAGSIEKAADGVTIAALWADKATHTGKPVTVRGRVVKFNGGIMGRNWIHLQDGSGDAAASTNDLTVTTDAVCAVGDVVTVTGTVVIDKDFGSGYRYGLLLEDAKVVVETSTSGAY